VETLRPGEALGSAETPGGAVPDLSGIPLVDQHCHGLVAGPLDRGAFEGFLTESAHPLPHGGSWFESPLGFAVRAVCPPLLGLPRHAAPREYLARRAELGAAEVTRRLVGSTGITDYLIDTGLDAGLPGTLLRPPDVAAVTGSRAHEVVRLELVAEQVLRGRTSAGGFAAAFGQALGLATATAVAVKSIAAYRYGLDLDPARPSGPEIARAAAAFLTDQERGAARLADPVLLRHLLWTGLDTGLPVQVHTGFGDADLTLNRADPALLTPFLRAAQPTGTPVVLLHCYPYHRNAAYLAHVFPHVYADIGLALNHTGARAGAVLAEFLELAPFAKTLFSTDAYGPPELYAVGTALFRTHLHRILTGWVAGDACTSADAERVARMIAAGNARQLYRLP
jgi:predicted TIM-barrel fold metal-dependent hydrolase